jgi:hypothetical protein
MVFVRYQAAAFIAIFGIVGVCRASQMTLTPGAEGQVNATLLITNPLTHSASAENSPSLALFLLVTPFDSSPDQKVEVSADVRVARLDSGPGFSIFTVLAPSTQAVVPIRVLNCVHAAETAEGKAKIELDFTYPFLSKDQRAILSAPGVVAAWTVVIQLARTYDPTELSFSPPNMRRPDGRTFQQDVTPATPADIWVVFPNPSQQRLSTAKVVASLLFGFLTLILQVPALKARRVGTLMAVLAVSLTLIAVSVYYTFVLAKRRDFIEWSAALVPHAAFALGAAVFVLVAKRRQAVLSGLVLLDSQPALFADVTLYSVKDGAKQEVKRIDTLEDGRYRFYVWCGKNTVTAVVSAAVRGAIGGESASQTFKAGERVDMSPLSLKRLPLAQPEMAKPGGQATVE